ncbi:MAG: glutamate--tRNA ligase family protein, partial [Pseudomonadota bacterium]
THVIRGDDHLNNTPRQINMYRALDAEVPKFAHLPMILGADGARLSKRHGAVSVMAYHDDGYLPHALLNYLVRLGWSHGDQELFSRDEMIELFDLADVNKSASTFNPEKLLWLNQHTIRSTPPAELVPALEGQFAAKGIDPSSGPALDTLIEAQAERVKTLAEMADVSRMFYEEFDEFDPQAAKKHLRPVVREPLAVLRERFAGLEPWTGEGAHAAVLAVAEEMELKLGKIAQPLRVAVTGAGVSPAIDITLALVGQARTLERMDRALAFIDARASA